MKTLKLQVDELTVASFETVEAEPGAVEGNAVMPTGMGCITRYPTVYAICCTP